MVLGVVVCERVFCSGKAPWVQKAPAQGGHKVNGVDKSSNHGKVKSVPGRKTFRAQLLSTLEVAIAREGRGAVMFVSLDGFRLVTEIFGDASGGQLVRAAVERVARCVRPGDTVAHMGENGPILITCLEGDNLGEDSPVNFLERRQFVL
ncbi:MAG TPA: diguanylate cyclase, partial [Sneathiellales bacterium]|nr:diguanylate cyclase [Sneathiellales bacterium]